MALAKDLPDEAVKAFTDVLRRGSSAKQLRVKDDAQLREAIAAAVGKVPLETLIGATATPGTTGVIEVVLGVELEDPTIPEGWQPEGVLALARGLDPSGNRSIFWRQGGDVTLWEMIGMLECCGDGIRAQLAAAREA